MITIISEFTVHINTKNQHKRQTPTNDSTHDSGQVHHFNKSDFTLSNTLIKNLQHGKLAVTE